MLQQQWVCNRQPRARHWHWDVVFASLEGEGDQLALMPHHYAAATCHQQATRPFMRVMLPATT